MPRTISNGDYIKNEARKFLNPFGKWRWLFKKLPDVIRQFLLGGDRMFREQGITRDVISEELKNTTIPDFNVVPAKKELIHDTLPETARGQSHGILQEGPALP